MAEPQGAGACANAAQAAEWDGPAGAHRTRYAAVFDAEPRPHNERLRAAAGIAPRDRVLDVGCGTGQTTRDAARAATDGSALGIDLSAQMLEHARRIAAEEGLANVSFLQADAQVYQFPVASFDVAISRFGTMFFADPVAAFGNVGHALRPGGRLVLMVWQGHPRGSRRQQPRAAACGWPAPVLARRPGRRRRHPGHGRLRRYQLHRRARAGLLRPGPCRCPRRGARPAQQQGHARGPGGRGGRAGAGPVARHAGRASGSRRRVLRRARLDHRSPAPLRIPAHDPVWSGCRLRPAGGARDESGSRERAAGHRGSGPAGWAGQRARCSAPYRSSATSPRTRGRARRLGRHWQRGPPGRQGPPAPARRGPAYPARGACCHTRVGCGRPMRARPRGRRQ